jgi:hypothetical protein
VHFKGYLPHSLLTKQKSLSEKVTVTFLVSGKKIGSEEVAEDQFIDTILELPDWLPAGSVAFSFQVSHTFTPASDSTGPDRRELGIVVKSVGLE